MYNILVHAHSGLRWIALLLILIAMFKAFSGMKNNKVFSAGDKKIALFTLISFHIQLLIGLVLYFMSPKSQIIEGFMKNPMLRFYGMEHLIMMIIAIVLVTMGYSKSKKQTTDKAKHKKIAVFYTIALIIVLVAIPWPFRENLLANWF